MNAKELSHFRADSPPSVVPLAIKQHFDVLTDQEKRYAHHISRAAWLGTRIVLRQVSPESESIFDFILALQQVCDGQWAELQRKARITGEDMQYFLEYTAQFLGNCGNYKSFGDSKFIPRCNQAVFTALAAQDTTAREHYEATKGAIFSSDDSGLMQLGYPEAGHMTTYYPDSKDITKAEIDAVGSWMAEKGLLAENTRLRKQSSGDFELLIASGVTEIPSTGSDIGKDIEFTVEKGPLKGARLTLTFGDYSQELLRIVDHHKKAAECSANEVQKSMHLAYAKSFEEGSMKACKDSQRYWIRDKSPKVECNIGFVETYRDPKGVRGEWEGFAAMVNLERTRAFSELVNNAEKMIPKLPWPEQFEKDKFLSPDFTSLEVLTFSGSGVPLGINIPNFDDIRMTEGFKNVSLGNVLSARASDEKIPFIQDSDFGLYRKYRDAAFEVQVGVHELLGHGTGKLQQETSPGVFNFDKDSPPLSPIDNKPISTWYKPGQTWGSVFGAVAGSYEECRAECVAMALACDFEILKIFGFGNGKEDMSNEAGDVLYVSYLSMARAGIASLEMWDPKSRKWGQAHSQARFSILRCFLQAGDGFCKLEHKQDDMSDMVLQLDRSKITTVGRKAVEKYLQQLHIYKTTADIDAGTKLYEEMTHVDAKYWGGIVRAQVMLNRQPRKIFVQANTVLDETTGNVKLVEYEPTIEGIITSFAQRGL